MSTVLSQTSSTALTAPLSVTTEFVTFGSLINTQVLLTLVPSSSSLNQSLPITSAATRATPSSAIQTMSSTTASPSPSSSSSSQSSGLSKGASIGIGVGLAVAVLLIIGGLLWFFSFHKRYQEDAEEVEIGPNATDYRRKGGSIDALSRPPTNHDYGVPIQHTRSRSKGNMSTQPDVERPPAPTPASMGPNHDTQMRRDGFF